MDDAQTWDESIHRVMKVTTQSWVDAARAKRLETLLAWTPSQNLISLLDRLYFRDQCGRPVLSQESSLAQLLLVAVTKKLSQLRRFNEDSLRRALLDLQDETFMQLIDGEDLACRSTRGMSKADRFACRQIVARLVLGEPPLDA